MTGFDLPAAPIESVRRIQFPLSVRFKLLALSHQFELIDAQGQCLGYVKQPWLKLKEAVTVYSNANMDGVLYTINADRILDISAHYNIATAQGIALGELQRHGLKSFFKAHYELHIAEQCTYTIQETNPWVKVIDSFLGEIPILGFLSNYFFHPRYALIDTAGQECLVVQKQASFFERVFKIESCPVLSSSHENTAVLASLMMILLESKRG